MKFFVIGNDSIQKGLDLKYLTPLGSQGCNFADKKQTLQQSFLIAEKIFKLVDKGQINFVLIGLTPGNLFFGEDDNFTATALSKNLQTLNDLMKLCIDNGTKPVGVILPVASVAREYWLKNFFNPLADILNNLKKIYDFKVVNFLEFILGENYFTDETHLTQEGTILTGAFLTLELHKANIFSKADFYQMTYQYFYALSYFTDKNFFHAVMNEIFSDTLSKLRRKDKIRVGFLTDHAAMWSGDKLYNLFAENPRFETTIFFCRSHESTLQDFQHDLEQFKSAGLNVVGLPDKSTETPPQDIVFFLRPYVENFSKSFQFDMMTPQTLLAYIPYGFEISAISVFRNLPIFHFAWKHFFDSEDSIDVFDKACSVGVPRGVVSGAPKLDLFFEDVSKLSFPWKMTRPDSKKIIWAPHHSEAYSTFPYNYQFMYEFAKAHPEISWVVKPHPRLMIHVVLTKIFPSVEAYEGYLQKWNELPNAQVYTGAYYHRIFATSDGLIQDSLSFIAEYQYTHKPMIYLLKDISEGFTDLGKKILSVSYLVDGKNHGQIAAALQKIFIEGNDPLKSARQKVFDRELNYVLKNGMTASEFIYKAVTEELEEIS